MTLFTATLILGLSLLVKGIFWLFVPNVLEKGRAFLRSRLADVVLFGGSSIWFLWHVAHLGQADFGDYKQWLFLLFAVVILGSFLFVKDFLAVRGWSVLVLLLSNLFLDAAYMQEPSSRLFLVGFTYLMIVLALYFGTVPYRMRDFLDWLIANPLWQKIFAFFFLAYGALLTFIAFSY